MNAALDMQGLRGELLHDAPLAGLTSWRVGGHAERLYRPADLQDLQAFLRQLPADEPLLWLGLGSNLLVRDGGVRGTVIALHARLDGLERLGDSGVRAGAGVPGAKLARFAARFEIGYRHVRALTEEGSFWFVAAEFDFEPGGDPQVLHRQTRELLANRAASQPTGVASCGSVFRNPPGDFAGRLIEAAGLKGLRRGGAMVAEKHGNFILNTGSASAADIEDLILEVQTCVEAQSGIRLQPEVRIVGEREAGA
ncbi:MAG: FAD-binding protein [Acidihalobacter sp.]